MPLWRKPQDLPVPLAETSMLEHINTALTLFGAAHGLALVIVNMTKTPKDDAALHAIYRVVEVIAGIVSPRAKK
jgi:uncharacterized YccA/Bax inhibitor family protein